MFKALVLVIGLYSASAFAGADVRFSFPAAQAAYASAAIPADAASLVSTAWVNVGRIHSTPDATDGFWENGVQPLSPAAPQGDQISYYLMFKSTTDAFGNQLLLADEAAVDPKTHKSSLVLSWIATLTPSSVHLEAQSSTCTSTLACRVVEANGMLLCHQDAGVTDPCTTTEGYYGFSPAKAPTLLAK